MPEGQDPCQLQRDAVAQSDIEVTAALQLLADRVQALMACEMEHSGKMLPSAKQLMELRHSDVRTSLGMIKHYTSNIMDFMGRRDK